MLFPLVAKSAISSATEVTNSSTRSAAALTMLPHLEAGFMWFPEAFLNSLETQLRKSLVYPCLVYPCDL